MRTVGLLATLAALAATHASLAAPSVTSREAAVEHGLTSRVVLAGAPVSHRTIAEEMDRLHIPGASVAVMHDGVIEWAKGFGITHAGGGPITADTLFQAASISKPVTALAALRLVQQHRLTLDDDVNGQLKGWKLPTPVGEHATLAELLSHTAGTTVSGFAGYASGRPVPNVYDILAGRPPADTGPVVVDTKPGTIWRYSGGGYTVVQKLMVDITGQPFAKVMTSEVLGPAGMTRSTFAQPVGGAALAKAAWPHDETGRPVAGGPHTYPELAAAGLWSTPSDLLRYAIAVRDSYLGKPGALLDKALATRMLTPGMGDYGLGLEVHGAPSDREFFHGGSNEGYRSYLLAYTASGDGVTVMTNGAQGYILAQEITGSVDRAYGWPGHRTIQRASVPISPGMRARLPGTYINPDYGSFSIIRDAAALSILFPESLREPLYASGPDTFFVLSRDAVFHVDNFAPSISGHLISGPHDLPFTKEMDAHH